MSMKGLDSQWQGEWQEAMNRWEISTRICKMESGQRIANHCWRWSMLPEVRKAASMSCRTLEGSGHHKGDMVWKTDVLFEKWGRKQHILYLLACILSTCTQTASQREIALSFLSPYVKFICYLTSYTWK